MTVGTLSWLGHLLIGWEWFAAPWPRDGMGLVLVLPVGLSCAVCALVAYLGFSRGFGQTAPLVDRREPERD